MAEQLYRATVGVAEYTDRDGNPKRQWANFGIIWETKNGASLKLDPVVTNYLKGIFGPNFEGWINLYPPDDERQGHASSQRMQQPTPAEDFDNEHVPF